MSRNSRRSLLAALAAVLAAVTLALPFVGAPAARAADPRDSFITRCGIRFCLDNRPYYFAGTNTYDVFTFGYDWLPGEQYVDKAKIDAHMLRLQNDKVQVLRLWMFSHEDWMGFEAAKGVYTEEAFVLFDYVIKSAREHSIRLIPVFENFWEAYGGIDKRLAWEGLPTGYANRWRFFNKTACPGCFTQYKNYVQKALTRTNSITGVAWKNDPTILAWELMNEPRYPDATPNENTTGTTLRAWVDEMGAYVKSLDPNHLLGTGQEGQETAYGYGGDSGGPFVYIQQSPYIDFTSAHMYPTEGWAGLNYASARTLLKKWISDSHTLVGKPFFLGEWNAHDNKTTWWTEIYAEMEASGGDGDAFWWYPANTNCGGFDSGEGCAEHAVFRTHSQNMAAKSGVAVSPSPSRSASPSPSLSPSPSRSASPSPSVSPSRSASPSPSTSPNTGAACRVTYRIDNSWQGGFNASVVIANTGTTTFTNWVLTFTLASGQTVVNGWNGMWTVSGSTVTITAPSWAPNLAPGQSWTASFTGGGTTAVPSNFKLNGVACATA
ncbi:cellulose binding domain-containing protein [Catellatospora tritici]|uniref:cellulose binding domain-containing protein n=1 Tax=Catellatospora tritici TaxID=2851566 RepID=UPI001C2DD40F|nr:cellulose binding domain-containing protein [Catellatospora tritici]MBV1852520.1 cellulose binding domain-containing protein [Catellatospora tritici]